MSITEEITTSPSTEDLANWGAEDSAWVSDRNDAPDPFAPGNGWTKWDSICFAFWIWIGELKSR